MLIPKIIHHVWVGPNPAPMHWIETYYKTHPDWEFILWDEEKIRSRKWRLQKHIDFYFRIKKYYGVADCVRYEILHQYGGFNPGADSESFRPIDELFQEDDGFECYTPYENEKVRPGLTSPIHASIPKASFLEILIAGLEQKKEVGEPWKTTGNLYVQQMAEKHKPKTLKIWPSYYFIPVHYTGEKYEGDFKPYSEHKFGSTLHLYEPKKA